MVLSGARAGSERGSLNVAAAIEQRAAGAPAPPAAAAAPPAGSTSQAATPPAAAMSPPQVKGADRAGPGRLAACRPDLQTHCASVPAGGGGKMRCLQENQAKLSPTCAEAMNGVSAAKQAARGACADDAKSLCPGLKGPERRACFTANAAKLSPACADVQARAVKR